MRERPSDISEYIQSYPVAVQKRLQKLHRLIKTLAPDAEESIAYGMPAFKTCHKPLVYFAAFKNHIGLYALPSAHTEFKMQLGKYRHGKGSVQFPLNQPMPWSLIKTMIRFRIEENKVK